MEYSLMPSVKILIVDDCFDNQTLISQVLGDEYDYVIISDVNRVISYFRDHDNAIALVMVCMDMLSVDGITVLEKLGEEGLMEDIPVIAYSKHPTEPIKNIAYDLGVADYLNLKTTYESAAKRVRNTIRVYYKSRIREINNADFDPLTGVYNLSGLRRCFDQIVKNEPDREYIFIYADIKNFKYYNKAYGFEEGNKLIKTWFNITKKHSNSKAMLCRIAGDQMVIMLDMAIISADPGGTTFEAILEELRSVYSSSIDDFTINIVAGVYMYKPTDGKGESFDQIIGYARQAQKSIKYVRSSGIAVYDDMMWEKQQRKIEINGHIDSAIKNGEVMLYLQPQYNYVSGELIGAECLCRWNHKTLGWVAPGEFIPALEETGKIFTLDCFVWETACQLLRKWVDNGRWTSLAVNVSRKDIEYANLPEYFLELVKKYDLEPSMLRIEITESVYMDDASKFTNLIRAFSEAGFSVEMDDFGSGFSSLNMLHNVNVDVLKLDMGFLRDETAQARSGSIINAIVKMAHTLDIKVLAEGVEDHSQAEFLKNIGCLMAQGYFFSKPIPIPAFEELMTRTSISKLQDNYDRYQMFNLQELFDRTSSGFFIFNNCMGPGALFEYNGQSVQPVVVNDEFVELLQWKREEIERNTTDVLPLMEPFYRKSFMTIVEAGLRDGFAADEIYSGRLEKYIHIFIRLVSKRDNINLFFCEVEDITKEKELEKRVSDLVNEKGANKDTKEVVYYERS